MSAEGGRGLSLQERFSGPGCPGIFGPHSSLNFFKALNGWGQQGWFCLQLLRMGEGDDPDTRLGVFQAFRNYAKNEARAAAALAR